MTTSHVFFKTGWKGGEGATPVAIPYATKNHWIARSTRWALTIIINGGWNGAPINGRKWMGKWGYNPYTWRYNRTLLMTHDWFWMPTFYRQPRWLRATQSVPLILKKDVIFHWKKSQRKHKCKCLWARFPWWAAYRTGIRRIWTIVCPTTRFALYRKPTLTTTWVWAST